MSDELRSILPSVTVLGAAAAMAVFLTISRGWAAGGSKHIRGAVLVALLTVLGQAAHFTEELLTGFDARFPALLGLPPMSLRFFVTFNVAWLAIWSLCAWGLAARRRAALFPLWFLGIACIVNGIAHPALALLAGGYFPGLVTSPIMGVLGVLLVRRLLVVTESPAFAPRSAT
ncbi:MAG: HXXEE domain-containing protein [Gemmatimonadota bacterium]|nr:HXXEE domain-containing protein [Gemmatimonadota bacterium]MDH5197402.1 HXXEE domain-containing protein [Gemmatimonadota bacterium]